MAEPFHDPLGCAPEVLRNATQVWRSSRNLSRGPADMDATTYQVKVPDAQRRELASPKAGVCGGEDRNPIVSVVRPCGWWFA